VGGERVGEQASVLAELGADLRRQARLEPRGFVIAQRLRGGALCRKPRGLFVGFAPPFLRPCLAWRPVGGFRPRLGERPLGGFQGFRAGPRLTLA
jgi:hypothetical protein